MPTAWTSSHPATCSSRRRTGSSRSSRLAEKVRRSLCAQTSPPRPPSPPRIRLLHGEIMDGGEGGGDPERAAHRLRAPLSLIHMSSSWKGDPPGRGGLGGEVCAEEEGADPFR